MRICFFANLRQHENWRELFEKIEFYRLDIELLRDLGHEVVTAGAPSHIDWKADLYYCWWWGHAPLVAPVAKLRRKPLVVTGAFDYATCREELPGLCYLDKPAWRKFALRAMLRTADANLFISQYEHDEVTRHLEVRNPICAPLAIDTDIYRPSDAQEAGDYFFTVSLQTTPNAIRKGLFSAVQAFARVASARPDIRLLIAGKPGDATPTLAALAEELGVGGRVQFLGMISDEEKLSHYRRCIAYVQPTLYEGFGHSVGEAVSCGTSVVSAARGAVPEVTGGHAACVDPHDIPAIAAAMEETILNRPSAQVRATRHQWIVDNFSKPKRRERLKDVLLSVSGTGDHAA